MSQLALQWSAPDRDRMTYEAILDIITQIVERASLKEAAFRLNVQPSALANALKERDRHYVRLDWLPAIMELAAAHDLAERLGCALVAPARLIVTQAEEMTPEQRLARLEGALASMPELADLVMKKAGLK